MVKNEHPVAHKRLHIRVDSDDLRTQLITGDGSHVCYIEQDPHNHFAEFIVEAFNNYKHCVALLEWVTRCPVLKDTPMEGVDSRSIGKDIMNQIKKLVDLAPYEYGYDHTRKKPGE